MRNVVYSCDSCKKPISEHSRCVCVDELKDAEQYAGPEHKAAKGMLITINLPVTTKFVFCNWACFCSSDLIRQQYSVLQDAREG